MANKFLKFKKQTLKRWRKDKRFVRISLASCGLLLFIFGMFSWRLFSYSQHPKNLVWAADKNTTIPRDLVHYLQSRQDCSTYRGTNNPAGVGLYSVYQISKNKFAKISYGCSTNLTLYEMGVKKDKTWRIIKPADYFSVSGYLPKCQVLDTYQINSSIEPYCILNDGSARANGVK